MDKSILIEDGASKFAYKFVNDSINISCKTKKTAAGQQLVWYFKYDDSSHIIKTTGSRIEEKKAFTVDYLGKRDCIACYLAYPYPM